MMLSVPIWHAKWAVLLASSLAALPVAAQSPASPAPPAPPAFAAEAPAPPDLPLFAFNNADEKMVLKFAGGRSYLGVDVTEIGTDRAKALKLPEERGVELTRVADDSPAFKAGLKAGDVVLEFNGQRVEGTEQFVRLVRETPVGRVVKLIINRGGSSRTVEATIGKRPSTPWSGPDEERMRRDVERARGEMERMRHDVERTRGEIDLREMRIEIPDMPRAHMFWRSPVLGIEGESLEGQLAVYFGVETGVLVRSVLKGTAAEKAGVKAGDVILKVGDTKVTTPREISSAIRSLNAKKVFPLMVRRNHKDLALSVTVEDAGIERRHSPRSRVVVHEEK
jgi:serine protease Do